MISRSYCFTAWKKPIYTDAPVRYIVVGEEICPTTGKLHYQGYVEFTRSVRMNAVKKYFSDNTMHLEKRKGSREQARCYCMKDKKYTEVGTFDRKKKAEPYKWNGLVIPIPSGYVHGTCYVCKTQLDMSLYPYNVYPGPHACLDCTLKMYISYEGFRPYYL